MMGANPQRKMKMGLMTDLEITIQKIGIPISCLVYQTHFPFGILLLPCKRAKFVPFNFEISSYRLEWFIQMSLFLNAGMIDLQAPGSIPSRLM